MTDHSRISDQNAPMWTLDDLCSVAEKVLDLARVVSENGRIRSTPDERTLRYYTTLGLLSRPATFRGRTALYHRHHLAQVVLIKRLQAEGLPLAEVQTRLAGLTPAELERHAQLPRVLPEPSGPDPVRETVRQERPLRSERRSLPLSDTRSLEMGPTGSWLSLGSGTTLMLPASYKGTAEGLLDILQAASPLLAELRRQGLIDPE